MATIRKELIRKDLRSGRRVGRGHSRRPDDRRGLLRDALASNRDSGGLAPDATSGLCASAGNIRFHSPFCIGREANRTYWVFSHDGGNSWLPLL
jgi:hypothetical protein